MKKSKFTEQQIAFILKQADDGVSVEDTCRKAGSLDKEMLQDVIRRKM